MQFQSLTIQLKKFVLIGFLSTAINYAVFVIFYKFFGVHYAFSHVIGYVLGVVFGYTFNRSWTFDSVIPKKKIEFILYFSIYISSLILSVAVLQILVEFLKLNPLVANILSIGCSMFTNFLGCKLLVFNQSNINRLKFVLKYFTWPFYLILSLKILASFVFGSHFLINGFVPFVKYFSSTFHNPYNYFSGLGEMVFPYAGGMLYIVSLPYIILSRALPGFIVNHLSFEVFSLRIGVMIADIIIYVVLCYLLPSKEKKVLWLYFASPILFYINYFHGQLDVIPTALLFLSLVTLQKRKNTLSWIILGLGIAVKTHLLAAIPFYIIYLYRNSFSFTKILKLLSYSILVFILLNLPMLGGGFMQMVLNNPEQRRLFALSLNFGYENLVFYIAPAAVFFILYKFYSYKKLNFDSLLLNLGLVYIVLVCLVPPMQGWYYWSLPFLIFFVIKFKESFSLSLITVNIFYLFYFIFAKNSDFLESFKTIWPNITNAQTPYQIINSYGINATRFENFLFTTLQTLLAAVSLWAYQVGTINTLNYQNKKNRFILGIGGDSGVGKSTFTSSLEKIIGSHNSSILHGDDSHKWERGDTRWKIISHLNPKGNNLHLELEHALKLASGEPVERNSYDHTSGKFGEKYLLKPKSFILIQGLMPFALEHLRSIQDLKIFIEAEDSLRVKWKTSRDTQQRGYSKEDVEKQIQERKNDSKMFIMPQKELADWKISYRQDNGIVLTEYNFKSWVNVDDLVEKLSLIVSLNIKHEYLGLDFQKLSFSGEISKEQLEAIAYSLFPNLFDLVENTPVFESNISGIHQLFFVNYLHNFNRLKNNYEKLS